MSKKAVNGIPPLPDDGAHEYMVLGGQSWGRGATVKEATRILKTQTSKPVSRVLIVPKGARINEMGNQMIWDHDNGHGAGFCVRCVVR